VPDSPRIISPAASGDDDDGNIRPQRLRDIIGQEKVVESLQIAVDAAKGRHEPLAHLLFYGPPGLGKTTLSHVLANEMGVNMKITAGPWIELAGDLAVILTHLRTNDILFIDQINRLGHGVEEILYPAMENFVLDVATGKGAGSKTIRLHLPKFTVIGATTRLALLREPLRLRFDRIYRFDFYSLESMTEFVRRVARAMKVEIDAEGANVIGRRGRGTPRIALRLFKTVRDYAQVHATSKISAGVAREALELAGIDPLELDDRSQD
jgi:Holliday junction DNA helicase RuvB